MIFSRDLYSGSCCKYLSCSKLGFAMRFLLQAYHMGLGVGLSSPCWGMYHLLPFVVLLGGARWMSSM